MKYITLKNIAIAALVIVIIYLLTCNRKKDEIVNVIPVEDQAEVVRIDSIASAVYKDSVTGVIKFWEGQAKKWQGNWNTEVVTNAELQQGMSDLLLEQVPDTCLQYQTKIKAQYEKAIKAQMAATNSCAQTINSKDNVIKNKDVIIAKQKKDYSALRINLDTCFSQQKKLEDSRQKVRNQVYIGVTAIGSRDNIYQGVGLNLGLMNKRGYMFEVGAIQIGSATQYTIGLKKVIKFR